MSGSNNLVRLAAIHALESAAKVLKTRAESRRRQAEGLSGLTVSQNHAQQILHAKSSEALACAQELMVMAAEYRVRME